LKGLKTKRFMKLDLKAKAGIEFALYYY